MFERRRSEKALEALWAAMDRTFGAHHRQWVEAKPAALIVFEPGVAPDFFVTVKDGAFQLMMDDGTTGSIPVVQRLGPISDDSDVVVERLAATSTEFITELCEQGRVRRALLYSGLVLRLVAPRPNDVRRVTSNLTRAIARAKFDDTREMESLAGLCKRHGLHGSAATLYLNCARAYWRSAHGRPSGDLNAAIRDSYHKALAEARQVQSKSGAAFVSKLEAELRTAIDAIEKG